MKPAWPQAEAQNWGYKRFLLHLCESEAQDRRERRAARLIKASKSQGSNYNISGVKL